MPNLYWYLGPKADREFLKELGDENILFDSKTIWVNFEARDVSGDGLIINSEKRLSRGRILITSKRFSCIVGGRKIINLPRTGNLIKKLKIDKADSERFSISCGLGDFSSDLKGTIKLSFHIDPNQVESYL